MKDQILTDFIINLEKFFDIIKEFNAYIYYIRGISNSFVEIQRLRDIFESILTEQEGLCDLPALQAIQGDFSILDDIDRLPL